MTTPSTSGSSRVIMYAQTLLNNKKPIPLLPLIQNDTGITHLVVAMLHLYVDSPIGKIVLNDNTPDDPIWDTLRTEIKSFQAAGVKVLCCLGGYTKGSYNPALQDQWDVYYPLLQKFLIDFGFNGLDIDIEEPVAQATVEKLIKALRQDFGANFLITLTPVASALQPDGGQPGGSSVDYLSLEQKFGNSIDWYNTQFYNGFGDINTTQDFDKIVSNGFAANKVVALVSTNSQNAQPYYQEPELSKYLKALKAKYPQFGGVGGWEYFNAQVTGTESNHPWLWLELVGNAVNKPAGKEV